MAKRQVSPAKSAHPLAGPLADAAGRSPGGVKPEALDSKNRSDKKNYAQALSNSTATMLAKSLRPIYPKARVTPLADGTMQEFSVGAAIDKKRTDVGVWDDAAGLMLGISVKTYTFRDYHAGDPQKKREPYLGRYVRNIKRNDMELRDEADTLHRRQPYAYLVAILFLPEDSCWDGVTGHSSFAGAVHTFRKRAGRRRPTDRTDLFEKVFVGLFESDGSLRFFDVEEPPRQNQPPNAHSTRSLADLIEYLRGEVILRNTGSREGERYAPSDPLWEAPKNIVVDRLIDEAPLSFEETLSDDVDLEEE